MWRVRGHGVRFTDRVDAGRRLAVALRSLGELDPVVLGLPRGGVPVAAEVARELGCPLDVVVVRKLGVPGQPELAMGAVGEDGAVVIDREIARRAGADDADLRAVEARERAELESRASRIRRHHPRLSLQGRVVIVVDDGLATGATARAACGVVRHLGAARIVLAAPVAPPETVQAVLDAGAADQVVCVATPLDFRAVGQYYRDFTPTSDAEVDRLLDDALRRRT
jgi:predicted phosphoribosyltransferase